MKQKVRFYRMTQLPEKGEIGGLYFVTDPDPAIWLCTPEGWEKYTYYADKIDLTGYATEQWVE
jgi:hypothetical protein